jgi:hypothetical protein
MLLGSVPSREMRSVMSYQKPDASTLSPEVSAAR